MRYSVAILMLAVLTAVGEDRPAKGPSTSPPRDYRFDRTMPSWNEGDCCPGSVT